VAGKPSIETIEWPNPFGEGIDLVSVGVREKDVFVQVLGEDMRAFRIAGWTHTPFFARQRDQLRVVALFTHRSCTSKKEDAAIKIIIQRCQDLFS
jgi:hypothetical protein